MPYEGQCLCGGCKIFVDAEPERNGMVICHCKDCNRCHGTAFDSSVIVPTESARAEGSVKLYEFVNPSSGNTTSRWLCAGCGSHLLGRSSVCPERTAVKAGNFEEFTKLPIVVEIFTKNRWPSIAPVPGALQFEDGIGDINKLAKALGALDENVEGK